MKVLVFGSREWMNEPTMRRILSKLPPGTIIVSGGAPGADRMAARIGRELGFEVREYPVTQEEWDTLGKRAGHLRNAKMLEMEHPDPQGLRIEKAFGFSTGSQNRGTQDMAQKLWAEQIRFELLF